LEFLERFGHNCFGPKKEEQRVSGSEAARSVVAKFNARTVWDGKKRKGIEGAIET